MGATSCVRIIVTPAATAHRLTARPALGVTLSVTFALAASWVGMTLSFYTSYPIGFWVTTVAFAGYLLATGWRQAGDRVGAHRQATPVTPARPELSA